MNYGQLYQRVTKDRPTDPANTDGRRLLWVNHVGGPDGDKHSIGGINQLYFPAQSPRGLKPGIQIHTTPNGRTRATRHSTLYHDHLENLTSGFLVHHIHGTTHTENIAHTHLATLHHMLRDNAPAEIITNDLLKELADEHRGLHDVLVGHEPKEILTHDGTRLRYSTPKIALTHEPTYTTGYNNPVNALHIDTTGSGLDHPHTVNLLENGREYVDGNHISNDARYHYGELLGAMTEAHRTGDTTPIKKWLKNSPYRFTERTA